MKRTIVRLVLPVTVVLLALGFLLTVVDSGDIAAAREEVVDCEEPYGANEACRINSSSTPTSTLHDVVPEHWNDNPTCAEAGFDYGFRINNPDETGFPSGTFTMTETYGDLYGGAPDDPNNSVTITSTDGVYLDWSATLGMDAVLVKGGSDANIYVYDPPEEEGRDTGLSTPGAGYGISHVEFCYDYEQELDVTKDVHTSFTRTYGWEIAKTPDGDYVGFPGDSFPHTYTVTVSQTYTTSDWTVTGTITIANNTPLAATIEDVTDVVSPDIEADVDCGVTFPHTLAASETLSCSYSAAAGSAATSNPFGDTNTVTVATSGDVDGGEATADVIFSDAASTVNEINPAVYVTDTQPDWTERWTASSYNSWSYTSDFVCPTDESAYVDGLYTEILTNTATISQTGDSASAVVRLECYAPVVDKDVIPAWEAFYDWDIFKNVDNTTFAGFPGDDWEFNYDVDVELTTYCERNFSASGTVSVTNHHPTDVMRVTLTDAVNGYDAVILPGADCDYDATTEELTIPVNSTATCDYTVDMGDGLDGQQSIEFTNIATATLGGGSFTDSATFTFGDVDPTLADGSEPAEVTATDDNATPDDATDDHTSGTITGTTANVITYQQSGECPTESSEYVNGVYELTLVNVAIIDQTDDSDSETVTVNCYAPAVDKDAETEWFEEYEWDITKVVAPSSHSGLAGDAFTSTYTVTVDQTSSQYGYRAFGTISVTNPHPSEPMTVGVADAVDGTQATVTCDGDAAALVVGAGATETCAYTVDLNDGSPRLNTATVTLNSTVFTATADVVFGDPIIVGYPDVNVTDTQPDSTAPWATEGDDAWVYAGNFVCPTDDSLYTEGLYTAVFPNTATISETRQSDDANVDVTCYQYATKAGTKFRDLNRNGVRDEGEPGLEDWTIDFWTLDAQGQPDTKAYTATTDALGRYAFDMVVPGTDYLVCEVLPDEWTQSYPTAETPAAAPCPTELGYAPYGYRINLEPGQEELGNDFGNWTTQAQPDIDLEKYVSVDDQATWHDADDPTGPYADAGSDVYFKFVVTNVGNVELSNITLSDSDFDVSGCTLTDPLAAGGSFECIIGPFDAVVGQHANTGETTGDYEGNTYSDTDDAHYFGEEPAYTFQKYINGEDADTVDEAVSVEAGDTLTFTYMLTNTGNVPITWTKLTDDVFGDLTEACELPIDVPVGETSSCDILRLAQEREQGQENVGTVSVEGLEDQTDPAWYRTSTPTPVTVRYFRAQGTGSAIELEWSVAAEIDMSGYYLYRAESSQFDLAQRLAFRVAEGSYTTYKYVDKNVEPGKTYWYWLVSIETDGTTKQEKVAQASMIASAPDGGFQIFLPFVARGH